MKQKNLILLIALVSLFLVGCGQTKSVNDFGSADNSSRDLPTNLSDPSVSADGKLALCNGFDNPSSEMSGLVSVHYVNQIPDFNQVKLQVTKLPKQFVDGDSVKVQMRLWHEQTRNNIFNAPNPTKFKIQIRDLGYYVYLINGSYNLTTNANLAMEFDYLSPGLISQVTTEINENYSNIYDDGMNSFFDQSFFLLQDVTISYQAVSMILYPLSGGDAIQNAEFLIPPFYSNPHVYQFTHDSQNLMALHPNSQLMYSNLTEDEYYLETNSFCEQML